MGILSKLFGSLSGIEKELEDIHVPMFQTKMSLPPSAAKALFRKMLKETKEESRKEGTSKLPANFAEILLQKEAMDKNTQAILLKKREEGVKDDDIRWWWGMNDLERKIMSKVDDFFRLTMYIKYRDEDGRSCHCACFAQDVGENSCAFPRRCQFDHHRCASADSSQIIHCRRRGGRAPCSGT